MTDEPRKGRPPKVTREQYLLIRIRAASGAKQEALAAEYGVSKQVIWRIVRQGLKTYEPQGQP